MAPLTLNGIRVLDLSRVLAGPLCTMMLGDLGADVIKVERPGRGDETRGWGPPFDGRGESAYFLSINRNKLSIAADLTQPRDRDLVRNLVRGADVVLDNFLPGALERMGLHPDELLAEHERLVWCTISGFGASSSRPGYDYVVQAEAGWMAITGDPAGEPMKSGVALADVIAGKDAAIAILAALARRGVASPQERRLGISLADSARAVLINVAQNALVSGVEAKRWGNAHANLVPYQLFQAADRAIVIAVGSDDQWLALTRALGLAQLEQDAELRHNAGRLAQRQRVVGEVGAALRSRTAAEWRDRLDAARVPNGIVKTVLEAVQDAGRASPLTGMPPAVGGEPRFPPPGLDQHGALIRAHLWQAFDRYPV